MAGLDGKALALSWRAALFAIGLAAAGAACSSGAPADGTSSTAGNGGAKNQGGSSSVGSTVIATSSSIATGTVGAGGSGGAGGTDACSPAAAAGSFWAQTAEEYGQPAPVSMCQYRGDVLLVVNTAAV